MKTNRNWNRLLRLSLALLLVQAASAKVVINEIFYHAPGELEDLQYVELLNDSDSATDLGGWSLGKGIKFRFAAGTQLEPHGFAVVCRSAGFKVHLQKDRLLNGMSTLNLIFEQMERFVLAEPMAFELYRRVENSACRTDFIRLTVDDEPLGYHLLCEQPNKAFLRENKLRDDGNLYKLIWFGHGLKGQHEKKTHITADHSDLEGTLKAINEAPEGEARWAVIRREFDVEQVINYFAVNLCLSHWDGFFNNYFAYHDVGGSGKWTLYPWDQYKTWGFHDGLRENEIFFDMPTSFGMEGDRPPGLLTMLFSPQTFGVGHDWWRMGGWFSRPLLANPTFRKLYLARVKEILEKDYTLEKWEPAFLTLEERLREEVRYRASLRGESPGDAELQLKAHVSLLREHLKKRRKFLLAQDEIRNAGVFDRTLLTDKKAK